MKRTRRKNVIMYFLSVYENRTMKLVEIVLRMGERE
jgi:hypothetical protein